MRGGWKKEIELELEGKFSESPYLIVPVLKKEREREKKKTKSNKPKDIFYAKYIAK